jgi:hypothetical protein
LAAQLRDDPAIGASTPDQQLAAGERRTSEVLSVVGVDVRVSRRPARHRPHGRAHLSALGPDDLAHRSTTWSAERGLDAGRPLRALTFLDGTTVTFDGGRHLRRRRS